VPPPPRPSSSSSGMFVHNIVKPVCESVCVFFFFSFFSVA
jgi:hypothetical protein